MVRTVANVYMAQQWSAVRPGEAPTVGVAGQIVSDPAMKITDQIADIQRGTPRGYRYKLHTVVDAAGYIVRYEMTPGDHRRGTPKPVVGGSNPPAPAKYRHEEGPRITPGAF